MAQGFLDMLGKSETDALLSLLAGPQGYGTDDFLRTLARPAQDFSMGDKFSGFAPKQYSNPFTPQPQRPAQPPVQQPTPPARPQANVPITARFGEQGEYWREGHKGVDFAVPEGTPVSSLDGGTVMESGFHPEFGNYIKVQHSWGTSMYAHGSRLYARQGQYIAPGQHIMDAGSTGVSTGPHMHLETTDTNGVQIDPLEMIKMIGLDYMGVQ